MYVLNKIDAITIEELDLLDRVPHYVPISGKDEWNFDELLEKIWEYAKMFRMYVHCRVIRVIRASCVHFLVSLPMGAMSPAGPQCCGAGPAGSH